MATRTVSPAAGNWSATTAWVEAAVPTAADDVVATATSGALTIDTAAVCRSADFTNLNTLGSLTGVAGNSLTIGTSTANGTKALVIPTALTVTCPATFTFTFASTVANTTLTADFGGKTIGNLTVNNVGTATTQLTGHGFIMAATSTLTLTQGTLDVNGQTCTWGLFSSSNTNTRSLKLGASNITVVGTGTVWDLTLATGATYTFSAGASTVTFTGATPTVWLSTSTSTAYAWNNVVFAQTGTVTSSVATTRGSGNVTLANLTVTAPATVYYLQFNLGSGGATGNAVTVTGTLTLTGSSQRLPLFVSTNFNLVKQVTAAAVSLSNVWFHSIAASGAAAPWTGTNLGDCTNNSGITFSAGVTRYWVGDSGGWNDGLNHWATSSGGTGTATIPFPQDTAVFDANSFSATGKTVTLTATEATPLPSMDFSAVTNAPTVTFNGLTQFFCGGLTLASGMTWTANGQATFIGSNATFTLTSAGRSFLGLLLIGQAATLTLADDLVATGTVTWQYGTFDAATNNVNVTAGSYATTNTGSNFRVINMGSGTWSITSPATGNRWNIANPTGTTINAGTSTIVFSVASANSRTFVGGGFTYNTLTYTVAGSTGGLVITGSNTFATINFSDATNARTLTFTHGTATTIQTSFNVFGQAGKLITINSDSAGNAATLSASSDVTENCTFLSLQDSTASGAGFWQTTQSSIVSNVSGWLLGKFIAASGGANVSGSAALQQILGLSASGGASAGGSANLNQVLTLAASGSTLADGSAALEQILGLTASGGAVSGGSATGLIWLQGLLASGGAVVGGAAALDAAILGHVLAVVARVLYLYENQAIQALSLTDRGLYLYENKAVQSLSLTERALYEYENKTSDIPFPWLEKLVPNQQYPGGQVGLVGDGFGDTASEEGSSVFLNVENCGIVSWQNRSPNLWPANGGVPETAAIVMTVPNDAVSGLVKVEETVDVVL